MLSSLAPLALRKKEEGLVPGFPNAKSPQKHLKGGEKKKEEEKKKEDEDEEKKKKNEKDEEMMKLKNPKKSEEMEKQGAAQEKQMMRLEEALCGDEPLIVPELGSHESLYLDGSYSDLEFLPSVSAGPGLGGFFPRLFKMEDLLGLEEAQTMATIEKELPRVLQQGPDGHFDWVSATIDLDQLPQYEETLVSEVQDLAEVDEEEEGLSSSSRMPSPSPSPAVEGLPLLPALPGSRVSKKRKGAPTLEARLPPLPPKKRKIGVVMDAEEKRERNRVSALKYRLKQRSGAFVTEDRVVELERENQVLRFEIMKEKQAIAELRQLLSKHGFLPSSH